MKVVTDIKPQVKNGKRVNIYLDGSYYYSEVSLPSEYKADTDYYSNMTTNLNEEKVNDLYSALKNYFYAYFNGDATKESEATVELEDLSDSFRFMKNYNIDYLVNGIKNSKSTVEREGVIHNFINEMWIEVGRTPLQTLYLSSYKSIQETNIKAGWSQTDNKNYGYYYPVMLFIASIESAILNRNNIIDSYIQQRKIFPFRNRKVWKNLSCG